MTKGIGICPDPDRLLPDTARRTGLSVARSRACGLPDNRRDMRVARWRNVRMFRRSRREPVHDVSF
jgi:hypothetical protein